MAANTSQTAKEKSTLKHTYKGKEYIFRPCPNHHKAHDEHVWKSYVLEEDAYCDGMERTTEEHRALTPYHDSKYTGGYTYKPKKKTNYIDTDRADGRPWRVDFTEPMTVTDARAIAYDMHKDDTDKSGEAYHLHLAAVEAGVKVLAGPDATEERIAALFHDAEEDDHTTFKHLLEIGCTHKTVVMIEAVSKRSNEEQNVYLNRILNAGKENHIPKVLTNLGISHTDPGMEEAAQGAMRVKAADLMHNLRHDRIEALRQDTKTKYTADRLLKKYRPALARLLMELSLIVDEDGQKKIATKPQGTASGSYYGTTGTSTYKGTSGKGTTVTVKTLFAGDWPTRWEAPILTVEHNDGDSTITLANGEVKTEEWQESFGKKDDRKMFLYPYNAWSTDSKITPHSKATEDNIASYITACEEQFDRNARSTTYGYTGEEDLSDLWDDEAGEWK